MKILGKSKNLNLNKTEISLNISLIRYNVGFLVSLPKALGICRLKGYGTVFHDALKSLEITGIVLTLRMSKTVMKKFQTVKNL